MKILHVTDLHYNLGWFDWLAREMPRHDVTCITGDFLDLFQCHKISMRRQADWVGNFLSEVRGAPVFCCTGNHDLSHEFEKEASFLSDAAIRNPNVRGDWADEVVGGVRFVSRPWGAVAPLTWPYTEPAVLLSHAPPAETALSQGSMGDAGDIGVGALAERLPPGSLVLSGHVHAPAAWCEKVGGTWCFNPGCAQGAAFPNHIVIDTVSRIAELRTAGDCGFPAVMRV